MLAFSTEKTEYVPVDHLPRRFALADIKLVTNSFDDTLVIGSGGFGKVYKGLIDDGTTTVAIKRLNPESKQGSNEFYTEVNTLYNLRHDNLVPLLGHVNEYDELILIYEYMANGTLADHLYVSTKKGDISDFSPLTWEQRLIICLEAARGLDYIHRQNFIHRDVKTTNILLDEKWVAKISDFGLSKRNKNVLDTHISTQVKGTFGYLDPDYYQTGKLTDKSDVYAFGVVLLEVLCGRRAVDTRLVEEKIALIRWVDKCVNEGKLESLIDPSLDGQIFASCLKLFVEVAIDCLHNYPYARPSMLKIIGSLKRALELQHEGTKPQNGRKQGMLNKMFRGITPMKWQT